MPGLPTIARPQTESINPGASKAPDVSVPFLDRLSIAFRTNFTRLLVIAGQLVGLDLSILFPTTTSERKGPVLMDLKKLSIGAAGVVLVALGGYLQSTTPEGITLNNALQVIGAALIAWLFPQPKGK